MSITKYRRIQLGCLLLSLCLGGWVSAATGGAALSAAGTTLRVDGQGLILERGDRRLFQLDAIRFNFTTAISWRLISANDDELVLHATFPAAVDYYKPVTDNEPRTVDLHVTRVDGGYRLHAEPEWGRQTTLTFSDLGDHFFGVSAPLQENNELSPDLRGQTIRLEVEAEHATWHENFASAYSAFFISSNGYGAFFDTFARGKYQFAVNGRTVVHHDTGALDWYIFPGANGAEIHRAYFGLIGQPKNLPAWGLGPVGWRDQNNGGAAEILDDIGRMNALHMPFTAWFVDRPYSDGEHAWSKMNFNADFAAPAEWIGIIRNDYGLEFMTWSTTATFGDRRFPRHLGGAYSYLDLSDPETAKAFERELNDQQYVYGVKGHKIDRGDENLPVSENWLDESVPPAERRNRYVYLMARVHDEALREAWGDDQVNFMRAAIHRTQPYLSAVWAGDPRSSWEGMRGNFANGARAAFLGFPVWGTDVGGYLGEGYIPAELFVRWLQAGSMSGLFEIKLDGSGGDGRDRLPWRYDESFQALFRSILEERMQFLPYLYSLNRTSGQTGTLMQPMAYAHLDDPNTYTIWDQFYLGGAILVAPIFEPAGNAVASRTVYLPAGKWRDFDDLQARFTGGQTVTVEAPLDKLPRFVRENSLYVTGTVYRGNSRNWDDGERRLTIHALPGDAGDETGFTYVDLQDGDRRKPMALSRRDGVIAFTSPALSTPADVLLPLDSAPAKVELAGQAADFSFERGMLRVAIPAGTGIELAVKLGSE